MSCFMTKPTKWPVPPAKTQISLRPVWSESSQSTWRKVGSLPTHWVHSEDSDQTGRMPRLIWAFAGRTDHFVGFVMRRLKRNYQWIPTFLLWCFFINEFILITTVGIPGWPLCSSDKYEPRHDKTCLCFMRTTKTQISLRIRAVWSAPLLLAS